METREERRCPYPSTVDNETVGGGGGGGGTRGHSPLSLGREATKPRLSGYRGHIVRARTRGTRGGESTARLAPSRQLEHSRPLRVLRVRSFVRYRPRYHLLFFLFFSARSARYGVPAPLFSPRPPSPSSSRREASETRERFDSRSQQFSSRSFSRFFPLLRSRSVEREIFDSYLENIIREECFFGRRREEGRIDRWGARGKILHVREIISKYRDTTM